MSEPIGVGDLVMVVRWPHEHHLHQLSRIWTVEAFADAMHCEQCNALWSGLIAWAPKIIACPVEWLKRIPPLEELEGQLDLADIRGPQPIKEHA